MKITLLAHKLADGNWEAFTDAFRRLNTSTEVEIHVDTLQKALRKAKVRRPEDLPKLIDKTDGKKYLLMTFEVVEGVQTLVFGGSDEPFKVKDPSPLT